MRTGLSLETNPWPATTSAVDDTGPQRRSACCKYTKSCIAGMMNCRCWNTAREGTAPDVTLQSWNP